MKIHQKSILGESKIFSFQSLGWSESWSRYSENRFLRHLSQSWSLSILWSISWFRFK
jgi:hypothetical protein